MPGKLIDIEGVDASGKKTQAKRLAEALQRGGKDVKYVEFPTYDSSFGSLVGKFLRGEFGEKEDIQPEIRCMLYAMDRYQYKEEYEEYLEGGGTIVANRYIYSNLHQAADLREEEQDELIDWIEDVERRLPQPDLVIFLDVRPEVAYELHEDKGERDYMGSDKRDIVESDLEHQINTYETYRKMCEREDNWIRVECTAEGEMKSIQEIHEKVMEVVEDKLLQD